MTCLGGIETEFAMVSPAPAAADAPPRPAGGAGDLARVFSQIRKAHPACHGRGSTDLYLANGARVYLDGGHLEYCTPETTTPADLVCRVLAGERIVTDAAAAASPAPGATGPCRVYKTNIDYGDDPVTFGCHENYGYRGGRERFDRHLLPYLCSRIIFCGPGGFDPCRPLQFSLSPRSSLRTHLRGCGSRVLLNGRDEPLTDGRVRRLHVTCGESQCSHLGMYLKSGTAMLIMKMIEAGLDPARDLLPQDPAQALARFAADPTVSARVPLAASRGTATAVQMQRAYVDLARANFHQSWMPPWAPSLVEHWQHVLDLLEHGGPDALLDRLDWPIKWHLYRDHIRRRGFHERDLPEWNGRLELARRLMDESLPLAGRLAPGRAREILRHPRVRKEMIFPHSIFESSAADWDRLEDLLRLRLELFEIDLRFAQLGPDGIFNQLDAAGALDHRLDEISERRICHAVHHPPRETRAGGRGRAIRRLARQGRSAVHHADWQGIYTLDGRRFLDLRDPFVRRPRWKSQRDGVADRLRSTRPCPYTIRRQALECYLGGRYRETIELLNALRRTRFQLGSTFCHLARAHLLAGERDEARRFVQAARRHYAGRQPYVLSRILFLELSLALLAGSNATPYLRRLKGVLGRDPYHLDWAIGPVVEHVRPRLAAEHADLLAAIAEAINDAERTPHLDRFEPWRRLEPLPPAPLAQSCPF